jgi:prepilin-type N-terminal cleavage/methylation domain-containing protein
VGFRNRRPIGAEGFSLIELLVVTGIVLVVATLAMPSVTQGLTAYRLRQSSVQLAGLLQQARISAVRSNIPVELRAAMINGNTQQQIYVDLPGANGANPNGQFDAGEPVIILPNGITLQTNGFPGDAYSIAAPGQTAQAQGTAVKFNSRGLPCVVTAGVCKNLNGAQQIGFVYYIRAIPTIGTSTWAAVTVTPAGRIKAWAYSGSTYK